MTHTALNRSLGAILMTTQQTQSSHLLPQADPGELCAHRYQLVVFTRTSV